MFTASLPRETQLFIHTYICLSVCIAYRSSQATRWLKNIHKYSKCITLGSVCLGVCVCVCWQAQKVNDIDIDADVLSLLTLPPSHTLSLSRVFRINPLKQQKHIGSVFAACLGSFFVHFPPCVWCSVEIAFMKFIYYTHETRNSGLQFAVDYWKTEQQNSFY